MTRAYNMLEVHLWHMFVKFLAWLKCMLNVCYMYFTHMCHRLIHLWLTSINKTGTLFPLTNTDWDNTVLNKSALLGFVGILFNRGNLNEILLKKGWLLVLSGKHSADYEAFIYPLRLLVQHQWDDQVIVNIYKCYQV